MAWNDFLKNKKILQIPSFFKKSQAPPKKEVVRRVLTVKDLMEELGVSREGILGTYETEEKPDVLTPADYLQMQENDGTVRAIVRLISLPIQSAKIKIIPGPNDKGEKDFIETVFLKPPEFGGMTTPLPFIIADMTRAIFEGFRLYEKVARVIPKGKWKGKIGWKKLAPREAKTIKLRADPHGGFLGAYQEATFGGKTYRVVIPPEKCILFTFQKERHWLYGESILKAAYYHYDKKHKLYYIAHKKAELEAIGLKILSVEPTGTLTPSEVTEAEKVIDTIGISSRVTLPPGLKLTIDRGGKTGYDPLPLIEHHNREMAKSALVQFVEQTKYAYPYGRGTTQSATFYMAIKSVMRQMEDTLNNYAVAPLIDWNFKNGSYPKIKLMDITEEAQIYLNRVFEDIVRRKDVKLPEEFVEEVYHSMAEKLGLEVSFKAPRELKSAAEAFELGKKQRSDELGIPCPFTPKKIKEKLKKETDPKKFQRIYELGREYAEKAASKLKRQELIQGS